MRIANDEGGDSPLEVHPGAPIAQRHSIQNLFNMFNKDHLRFTVRVSVKYAKNTEQSGIGQINARLRPSGNGQGAVNVIRSDIF